MRREAFAGRTTSAIGDGMKKPINARLTSIMRTPAATGVAPSPPTSKSKPIGRRANRDAKFKFASVHCENGAVVVCVAVNFDQFGARLRFSGEASLPRHVLIVIPEIGLRRTACFRWRRGCEAGFEFVNDEDQEGPAVKN